VADLGTWLRCVIAMLGIWSLSSVVLAVPVAALFRAQARVERQWLEASRRRAWREAAG
jgi:hypothetical protein